MKKIGTEYQKNINALIPKAEMFANIQVKPTDYTSMDAYYRVWNGVFHLKMDELAKTCGRVKIGSITNCIEERFS